MIVVSTGAATLTTDTPSSADASEGVEDAIEARDVDTAADASVESAAIVAVTLIEAAVTANVTLVCEIPIAAARLAVKPA